jgi:hypothetical protein
MKRAGLAQRHDANAVPHDLEGARLQHVQPVRAFTFLDQHVAIGKHEFRQIDAHGENIVHQIGPFASGLEHSSACMMRHFGIPRNALPQTSAGA